MHILTSPIQSIKLHQARKKQKQTALHMLTLSGVIRPGHVELRYAAPIASISAFRAQPRATGRPQSQPLPARSGEHMITLKITRVWQWMRSLSSTLVQLANKPIHLQWTKQLDI